MEFKVVCLMGIVLIRFFPCTADSLSAPITSGASVVRDSSLRAIDLPIAQEETAQKKLAIALQSFKDEFEIPTGLYALDDSLKQLKREITWRRALNKSTGTRNLGIGMTSIALGGVLTGLSIAFLDIRGIGYTITGIAAIGFGIGFSGSGFYYLAKPVATKPLTEQFLRRYGSQ